MDGKLKAPLNRRRLIATAGLTGATLALPTWSRAQGRLQSKSDLADVEVAVDRLQGEAVKRLQNWIGLPSIAAESLNSQEGAQRMADLLRDAGFQTVKIIQTRGKPGVFAKLDAGAERTTGVYFMYDVKQFDPAEWSSPPLQARIVDRPGVGKVMIGRGVMNQKGPEATFLAALHALRAAGRKSPVNIVLVAEGEEEIGSPNIADLVLKPEVLAALKGCREVWTPSLSQNPEGDVTLAIGNKGLMEVELTCTTAAWKRGSIGDIHSLFKAELDSPVWRLVLALGTLVSADGNDPAIDSWFDNVKPLTSREKQMVAEEASRTNEAQLKKQLGIQTWVRDLPFRQALERLYSQPTINIEGIFGGYTGPGGKTVLPSKASVKLDFRLVPNQTAAEAASKLKAHLIKRGYEDIEVNVTGAYDPSQTDERAAVVQAALAVYKTAGIPATLSPRSPGSNPSYIFTRTPVSLPRGNFGMGNGGRLHAPDEYYVIDSVVPAVRGMRDATLGYVQFLFALSED